MDLFEKEAGFYSNEMKARAGFGKDGEKGFEGTLTDLQMRICLMSENFAKE